jgi:hypothetical protein
MFASSDLIPADSSFVPWRTTLQVSLPSVRIVARPRPCGVLPRRVISAVRPAGDSSAMARGRRPSGLQSKNSTRLNVWEVSGFVVTRVSSVLEVADGSKRRRE